MVWSLVAEKGAEYCTARKGGQRLGSLQHRTSQIAVQHVVPSRVYSVAAGSSASGVNLP